MPSTSRTSHPLPVHPRLHSVLLLLLVAALAGCGVGGDDAGATGGEGAAMSSPAGTTVAGGAGGGAVAEAAGDVTAAAPVAQPTVSTAEGDGGSLARLAVGQRIAQTADLTLRIGKGRLDETLDGIALDAQRLGGYVVSSGVGDAGGRTAVEGTIVVRVPARRFLGALRSVGARARSCLGASAART